MTYTPSKAASNFQPSGFQQNRRSSDGYLESSVRHASPARLRLMVLERSVEVARTLANSWREKIDTHRGPNEYSVLLLDLITELLSGVTSSEGVCSQVADLYVFLSQHLLKAEEHSDAEAIDEIRIVLETEADTWRMVCANETLAQLGSTATPSSPLPISSGLNLQA